MVPVLAGAHSPHASTLAAVHTGTLATQRRSLSTLPATPPPSALGKPGGGSEEQSWRLYGDHHCRDADGFVSGFR